MSGNKTGGARTAATLLKRDPDYYKKIGSIGGKKTAKDGAVKGFAAMPTEKVSAAGRKGGTISRRYAATMSEVNRQYLAVPGTVAADNEKDDEINEIAEQVTKDVMSYEVPKRPSFLDRFKKVRA